jgi:Mn-dependent DtxR family transcriptional regulator
MHKKDNDLRVIEEEIMEVLFDLQINISNGQRIRMGDILNRVGEDIAKTQLTNIVRRKLEPQGYVDYLPYEGIILTSNGYKVAKRIARNHRLAEAMLYQIFDVPLELLHDQACNIEHGITDEMAEYIFKKLKVKKTPFGAPIPMGGTENDMGCTDPCLYEIKANTPVILTRIQNHSTETAKKLLSIGIEKTGTKLLVKAVDEEGTLIEINNKEYRITTKFSRALCVKPDNTKQ